MVYGGTPATSNTDAVRLYIRDMSTSSGSNLFTDVELTYFLNSNASILWASAAAADAASAKFSGTGAASMKKVGDLQLSFGGGNPAVAYRDLASSLRMQAALSLKPFSGGISVAAKQTADADTDRVDPGIKVGMHDNIQNDSSTGGF